MDSPKSTPARLFSWSWEALGRLRRVAANLLFLAVAISLLVLASVALFSGPTVPRGGALVLRPVGDLVEQVAARSPDNLVTQALSGSAQETLLKDQVDALAFARDDARIGSVYLDLSRMTASGLGMTKLEDLRAAILDFRKSGKKVIAYADGYPQAPYYLAAAADEVWMPPQGAVLLDGFSRFRTYYKDGIDKLGIDWHVFRVGEYKSAVEPYLRNDPSPEARAADLKWMNDLWTAWVNDVAAARKLKPEAIHGYIDQFAAKIEAAKGDTGALALSAGLVDKLAYHDELRAKMIALAGEDKKTKSFLQVSVADYLEAKGGDRSGRRGRGDAVAVIVARGEILDGKQPEGKIGGESTAAIIRKARQDEKVRAIVLRVDSPGGSAFASEMIRRELVLARSDGKKVVVSMGAVAASGGYWISTASDEIWASPETITGSIGIFGMFPSLDKPLANLLGVHVDGVGTTWLSGALRPERALKPEVGRIIQQVIDHGYEEFLARVGEARKMSRGDVDRIARGRVWSGADAKERNLVDQLGGLPQAIASAEKLSGLPATARVWYVERDRDFGEQLLAGLMKGRARVAATLGLDFAEPEPPPLSPVLRAAAAQLGAAASLLQLNDPHGVYAHCMCGLD